MSDHLPVRVGSESAALPVLNAAFTLRGTWGESDRSGVAGLPASGAVIGPCGFHALLCPLREVDHLRGLLVRVEVDADNVSDDLNRAGSFAPR